jgi:hypothetical protein
MGSNINLGIIPLPMQVINTFLLESLNISSNYSLTYFSSIGSK